MPDEAICSFAINLPKFPSQNTIAVGAERACNCKAVANLGERCVRDAGTLEMTRGIASVV